MSGPWLSDGDGTECAIEGCTRKGRPQICNGDGKYHHHGCVHEFPGTPIKPGPWRWMCDEHYAEDKARWLEWRGRLERTPLGVDILEYPGRGD